MLVRTAERRLAEARERLDAIDAAPPSSTVIVHGETFTLSKTTQRIDGKPEAVYDASGALRHPRREGYPTGSPAAPAKQITSS
ncbi:hypothetical protein [Streptomyces sp. TRM68367]|uniref:hypothetical protein n=1 Tax=Streptomyces sp. TRM68367 TaxID=2758415 RepID=UPI00165C902A|nr:hypothetical protein [Streptomyces sp. TRM68367]MBC9726010.1 hypothetical protein [Streptomyces sp. TRM68367]